MAKITWLRNRGRNGWDDPIDVGPERSVESVNVHLYDGGLGTRRGGSTSITITGVTTPILGLHEFIPGQDLTASELFVVDSSAPTKILRCAAGSSFSSLTVGDAISTLPRDVCFCGFNGKLFMAYDSTLNRLHCFEAAFSATALRRVGLGKPAAAPTVADTGAGTYPATIRYYRVRFREFRAGVLYRESPPSASVSFTPSGGGTAARVTAPALINEGETHWVVEASPDGVLFYDLAVNIVVATTISDDSANPATYADNDAAPEENSRLPFPSVKYLGTDGSRLLGFGVYESAAGDSITPKSGRLYYSAQLDSSTLQFDEERINDTTTLKGYLDISRNAGGVDRGLTSKPVNGVFYAFQSSGVYALIPTDSPSVPFKKLQLDPHIGAVNNQSIVVASDRKGQPCVFFLDPVKGPYVVGGSDGLKWCGKDLADLWSVNQAATGSVAWGLWYPAKSQVWFGFATGASNFPATIAVLDVTELQPDEDGDLRGGWTVYDRHLAEAYTGVMFSDSLAATRAFSRVPYTAGNNGTKLLRYEPAFAAQTDDGQAFQAFIKSGGWLTGTTYHELQNAHLMASPIDNVTVRQSLMRNGVDESARTSTVTLSTSSSDVIIRKFEDAALQDAWTVQVQLGDATEVSTSWRKLHQWHAELMPGSTV